MEKLNQKVILHPSLNLLTLSRAVEAFRLMAIAEGQSKKTLALYRYVFDSFGKWYGQEELCGITANQLRGYLAYLAGEKNYKPNSVHVCFRCLRTFFNFLAREGLLEDNPIKLIKPPRLPKAFPFVLSEIQVQGLLKAPDKNSWAGLRNYVMLLTFLDTGLRLSELINLELKDLDLTSRSLRVIGGKGNKTREIFMGKTLQKALVKWLKTRGFFPYEEALFPTQKGERFKPRQLLQIIHRLAKKAGISGVRCSPHTLRHTFATNYIRNGGDPFSLQQLLGHSDIKTVMIYVHMGGTALREAHAKFSPVDRMAND